VLRVLPILLLALLALPAGAAAADRRVPQGWLGVTADGPLAASNAGEWQRMPRAGVESVRASMLWTALEPRPGAFDFSASDAVVAAAAARGMPVLPVVQHTPPWAATRPADAHSPPRDPAAVEALFVALVGRYGPSGTFWAERRDLPRLAIRAWQVWNEPNHAGFWSEQPYAESYVRTLTAAAAGIRRADPGATVVLAGLTNTSWIALRQLYDAGAHGQFDVVALHPYTARPADVLRLVRLSRRVMREHGDAALPVWITELSWPAAQGRVPSTLKFEVDDRQQASLLGRALHMLAAARKRLRIERVYWYTWLSSERGPSEFDWAGLRRIRGGRTVGTPALWKFRQVARKLEGCRKAPGNAARCA
jgi:hypothetical protein